MVGGLQGEEWKFIQKYLKEKISCGVSKTEEISHHAWAGAKFAQAWSSCFPKAISSSFQLQIIHSLKR